MKTEPLEKQTVSYDTKTELPMKDAQTPTEAQFGNYQALFDYWNDCLFGDKLPHVILNFSRSKKTVGGFFAPKRWLGGEKPLHEISMNPESLKVLDTRFFVSIFVHEMAHLWQQELGKAPRAGYHDKQWGDKMEAIGLMPSSTGEVDGKRTGQRMGHYVIEGGQFDAFYEAMPKELLWPFTHALELPKPKKEKDKFKYTCEGCDTNVWGKKGLHIACETCGGTFVVEG